MKLPANFKEELYQKCHHILDEKIRTYETSLLELMQGAQNESKSSAGDKHETARAMMQIEQDKINRQLLEAKFQKDELQKINFKSPSKSVVKGSLVNTNRGYIFLTIALGKIQLSSVNVIVLSAESPLGKKLIGSTKGSQIEVNGQQYCIEDLA